MEAILKLVNSKSIKHHIARVNEFFKEDADLRIKNVWLANKALN